MAEQKQGVISIHGKSYKTVACRLSEVHEHWEGSYTLKTELLEFDVDSHCVMKATLGLPANGPEGQICEYTGHAFEKTNTSQINKTSHLENCETSAIGRALASAGYLGSEFSSADELVQAISQQAIQPVDIKTTQPITQPITEPPQNVLWHLLAVSIKRETEKYTILTLRTKSIEEGFDQEFDFFQTEQCAFENLVQAVEGKQPIRIEWKKGKQFEKYMSYDAKVVIIEDTADIPF